MDQDDYIKERLEDQITWYSSKSSENQKRYKVLRISEIVAAAIIPFIAGMGDKIGFGNWIVGILGVIVAVTAGFIALHKNHELWIQYRTTCEQLKHEKYLFLTACEPYNGEDAFKNLVARVEGLISRENSAWQKSSQDKQSDAEQDVPPKSDRAGG